jgi:hypothetical protein
MRVEDNQSYGTSMRCTSSIVDLDAGSGAFLTPGSLSGMGKKSRPISGMNIPDPHQSEKLHTDPHQFADDKPK